MKSFRFRFIILGLLLCIYHVWCRTCGTIFTDPASSTYLAQIVIEGTVSQKLPLEDLYSVRIHVKKVRKGDKYLPRGKRTRHLIIGDFSDKKVSEELCIPNISNDKQKYFFFLKNTTRGYRNTAFPVVSSKKTSRDVRKLACRTCDKAPILKPIKVKKVREGRRLQISCRLRTARPAPEMVWKLANKVLKNGKDGFKIKKTKRGIVLRKKKASLSDSGKYVCEAKNVVGTTSQEILINVHPNNGKQGTKKPKKKKTTPNKANPILQTTPSFTQVTTMPELFHECPDNLQGLCFNGGTCEIIADLGVSRCRCPATHQGKRCEHRKVIIGPIKDNMDALKKDRTLTIIGLVIGVLIFICMGIAGYILAKRRRTKFYRRQAEKRQQNEMNKNIPPSYSKLPSLDEVSEVSKLKLYERVIMKHREIQTDESSFLAPNPHTNPNMHLYLNPIENDILRRNPDARRNSHSRQRLSGVSDRGSRSPVETGGNQIASNNLKILEPDELKIPRIPKFSEADASSDDEKNALPPLEICEQEQFLPTSQQNGICDNFVDTPLQVSPSREIPSPNTNPTVTYTPPDSSQTLSSSEYSPSTEENSPHQNNSDNCTIINNNVNNYNDNALAWNERGSIENVHKPKYNRRRSSADTRRSSLSNQNEMYFQLASSSGANFHIHDLRDDDVPSIPV